MPENENNTTAGESVILAPPLLRKHEQRVELLVFGLIDPPKASLIPKHEPYLTGAVENFCQFVDSGVNFPSEHWAWIRTNNVLERLNREIRRETRVVGCFPAGNSALMLVCARLRHVAGTQWGNKKDMNMKHLAALDTPADIAC